MTLKERIQAYCQYKGISVSQFERQAGLSNGYFKEGSKMPRPDRISKILNKFPDINRNWLLYEEEPMLKTTDQPVSQGGEDVTPTKAELINPKTMERFLDSLLRQNEELIRQNGALIDLYREERAKSKGDVAQKKRHSGILISLMPSSLERKQYDKIEPPKISSI